MYLAAPGDHGNELSGSIKCEESLD